MRQRWSTSRKLAVLAVLLGTPLVLFTLRCFFLHTLVVRNQSDAPASITCRSSGRIELRAGAELDRSYAILGRSVSCVVASGNNTTACSRKLRALEDVYIAVLPDGTVDCDDY